MDKIAEHVLPTFHDIIQRNVEFVLDKVQAIEGILSTDLREQAFHTLSYSLNLASTWPATCVLLSTLSPKLEAVGYWKEWVFYLEQGIAFSLQQSDTTAQASLNLQLGRFYRLCNRLDNAHTCLTASAATFAQLDDFHNQAEALAQLAYVARRRRQNVEAERFIQEAFSLCVPGSWAYAACYSIQGAIAYDAHQYADAVVCYQQALLLWQQLQEESQIAWAHNDLGVALNAQGRYRAAVPDLEQAIGYFSRMQAAVPQGVAHMNLGISHLALEAPERALAAFDAAAPLLLQSQDEHYTPLLYNNRANAYRQLKQWSAAEEACQAAIVRFRQQSRVVDLANALDELGWIYLEQGCTTEAITAFTHGLEELSRLHDDPELSFFRALLTQDLQHAQGQSGRGTR